MSEPKYWNSWKGRVIKAIVAKGEAQTWSQIRDITELDEKKLNITLREMHNMKIIKKKKRGKIWVYRVIPEYYKQYRKWMEISGENKSKQRDFEPSHEKPKKLIEWVEKWKEVSGLDFSMDHKHFFLEGRHLDDFSKKLISHAIDEVLVVNPFVERCDMSKLLGEVSKKGIKVKVITRPPNMKNEYHEKLKEKQVTLTYDKNVHAKIIVVDREVTIVSSMNLYARSTGGQTWETGIISFEDEVVESVVNSVKER